MGTTQSTITSLDLYRRIGTPAAPLVLDLRSASDAAGRKAVPTALCADPDAVNGWDWRLPRNRQVVVYDPDGDSCGPRVADRLRQRRIEATALVGGFAGWTAAGMPTIAAPDGARAIDAPPPRWVTRERPKIDRIACPWLIRRFIDLDAEFLYVPSDRVRAVAAQTGATPFDIADTRFGHFGGNCSFDAFIDAYGLNDPALAALALIVRAADTGRPELSPQAPGLLAMSTGLSVLFADDHEMLRHGFLMYDALFAHLRTAALNEQAAKPRENP